MNNPRAVQFRKWAGQIVKDYAIQSRTMDKEHLKNGHMFTDEYFDRQLQYIREIRLSSPGIGIEIPMTAKIHCLI